MAKCTQCNLCESPGTLDLQSSAWKPRRQAAACTTGGASASPLTSFWVRSPPSGPCQCRSLPSKRIGSGHKSYHRRSMRSVDSEALNVEKVAGASILDDVVWQLAPQCNFR